MKVWNAFFVSGQVWIHFRNPCKSFGHAEFRHRAREPERFSVQTGLPCEEIPPKQRSTELASALLLLDVVAAEDGVVQFSTIRESRSVHDTVQLRFSVFICRTSLRFATKK